MNALTIYVNRTFSLVKQELSNNVSPGLNIMTHDIIYPSREVLVHQTFDLRHAFIFEQDGSALFLSCTESHGGAKGQQPGKSLQIMFKQFAIQSYNFHVWQEHATEKNENLTSRNSLK